LVPLEVKLALKSNVFGWDHLTSDILGHIFFTVAAFVLTYMALYFILEKMAGHHYYYNRLFFWLQWTLSLLAGWSSFRVVQRRRRIWLRGGVWRCKLHSFGSNETGGRNRQIVV
jgi:hypothetical protein